MAIDGSWKIIMKTPIGDQELKADFVASGASLTGTLSSAMLGSAEIEDGRTEGDKAWWTLNVSQPMKMTLKFEADVTGDAVAGTADVGMFGKSAFTGNKV